MYVTHVRLYQRHLQAVTSERQNLSRLIRTLIWSYLDRPNSSRPVVHFLLDVTAFARLRVMNAMRDAEVSLQEILAHETSVLGRGAKPARERLPALVARLMTLALVLPKELHPAVEVSVPAPAAGIKDRTHQWLHAHGRCSTWDPTCTSM